jgi:FkbM family methyltransferase
MKQRNTIFSGSAKSVGEDGTKVSRILSLNRKSIPKNVASQTLILILIFLVSLNIFLRLNTSIATNENDQTHLGEGWVNVMHDTSICKNLIKNKNAYIAHKKIDDHSFDIEIYPSNDIVSQEIRNKQSGWDGPKVAFFKNKVIAYSKEKKIPLDQVTFVDIGGNIGWFSLNMAALGVKVIAFEPMQKNIEMIRRSLCSEKNLIETGLSKRIWLFENGLGAKEETCFVFSDNRNEGDGHVQCVEKESDVVMQADYSIRGKMLTKCLDDVVSIEGENVAFVKMDVEGYEANIVEGGANFFFKSKIPFIYTEFVPDWIRGKHGDPEKMMNDFYDAGYKIHQNGHYLTREKALDMKQYRVNADVLYEYMPSKK